MKNSDLIQQMNWLLERMTRGQILRALSYANRIYVAELPIKPTGENKEQTT